MKYIIEPKSVVIVGATDVRGKVGEGVTRNALSSGYSGKIYLVNPKHNTIFGRKAYPSIKDIDEEIDLVEIIVPAERVIEVISEAAKKGAKGAIVVSAGFAEVGNKSLQEELVKVGKENNIRIIGPNCFGIINTEINLDLTFTFTRALKGSISFISQSGAMCCGLLDCALQQEVGFSKFINLGNKCDVDEADILAYLMKDQQTNVIAMYIEEVKAGKKLIDIAKLVTKKKPIVAIKSGVSEAGSRAALSHTGSIAGSDDVVIKGAFKQAGIIRVSDIEELLDVAIALSYQPIMKGKNVAIVSNAGGLGVMVADWCSQLGLNIPAFPIELREKLRLYLPPIASPINPIDMTGSADYECYSKILNIIANEKFIDGIISIYVSQGIVTSDGPARAVVEFSKKYDKPILAFWMGGVSITEGLRILKEGRIPTYTSPARVAKVMSALSDYGRYLTR